MEDIIFFELWLLQHDTWLDDAVHAALTDPTNVTAFDPCYCEAFTSFLTEMELLSEMWFDVHVDWLHSFEAHEAYLDPWSPRHDPEYTVRFKFHLRYRNSGIFYYMRHAWR